MRQALGNLLNDESGQDLPEYAVLIGLVALTVIAAVALLGGNISTTFNDVGSSMSGASIGG
ncbi:MAG: Flp family type IVb pilin [Gemmatimonadota bacterium]